MTRLKIYQTLSFCAPHPQDVFGLLWRILGHGKSAADTWLSAPSVVSSRAVHACCRSPQASTGCDTASRSDLGVARDLGPAVVEGFDRSVTLTRNCQDDAGSSDAGSSVAATSC